MRRASLLALLPAVVLAACGGGGERVADTPLQQAPGLPQWVTDRLGATPGPDVGLVMGSGDFGAGVNRVTFLVVRNDGELVQAPTAQVLAAREKGGTQVLVDARLEPIPPHSHSGEREAHDHPDVTDIYVAQLALPRAGRYWLVVEPAGEQIQGVGSIDVRERTLSPPVGSQAPRSDTPTLADAPAAEITTANPPDVELLRHSIAESLADHVPFVVVFATPAFCQSRTCGPTVAVVDAVRRRFDETGIRFIHVEIFAGNDPQNGYNRWVRQWNLPSEPWVFLVDERGVIRAKFEGSVSVAELERALRRHLRAAASGA